MYANASESRAASAFTSTASSVKSITGRSVGGDSHAQPSGEIPFCYRISRHISCNGRATRRTAPRTNHQFRRSSMKPLVRLASSAALAAALVGALAAPALANPSHGAHALGADHVVFVQTDNTAGNQVVAYDRADNGTLTLADTYNTGGLGGVLNGSAVDHLASQGSLTYDRNNALLYAVNAGSNTV